MKEYGSAVCFGMAGIDYEIDKMNFKNEIIKKIPLTCKYCIENDVYIALKAESAAGETIILNAGTGIKIYGTSGMQEKYSDAVGISSLQDRILIALGRELELNSQDKTFSKDLLEILNVENPFDYLQWLFLYNQLRKPACPYPEDLIRGYPKAFFDILRNGNSKAQKILDDMIEDFVKLFLAMASRLESSIGSFKLVLSGSIFTENRDLGFSKMFREKFKRMEIRELPKEIVVLKQQPYAGAVKEAERLWRSHD